MASTIPNPTQDRIEDNNAELQDSGGASISQQSSTFEVEDKERKTAANTLMKLSSQLPKDHVEAGKQLSPKDQAGPDKETATPSFNVAPSSTTPSSNERKGSDVPEPNTDYPLDMPSSGLSARKINVPNPISTNLPVPPDPPALARTLPLPANMALPSFSHSFGGNMETQGRGHSTQTQIQPVPQRAQSVNAIRYTWAYFGLPARNCYAMVADEIGLKHGVPGIGNIANYLTPQGWVVGDDPMTEKQVDSLHTAARIKAKEDLEAFAKYSRTLSPEERRVKTILADQNYQAQQRLDNVVRFERVKLARRFIQWKQEEAQRVAHQQQHDRYRSGPQGPVASPSQPTARGHAPNPQQYQQAPRAGNPSLSPVPPLNLAGHLQFMHPATRGVPQEAPASPSILDSTFVPQTYDVVVHCYNSNRAWIMQFTAENENFLATWSAHFGRQRPQGSLTSPYLPPTVGAGAEPFASIHYGPAPAGRIHPGAVPVSPAREPQAHQGLMALPGHRSGNGQPLYGGVMQGFHVRQHMQQRGEAQRRQLQATNALQARQNAQIGQPNVREIQIAPPQATRQNTQIQGPRQPPVLEVEMDEPEPAHEEGPHLQARFTPALSGPQEVRQTSASQNSHRGPKPDLKAGTKPVAKADPKPGPKRSVETTPTRKKAFQDEITNANLPTSVISAEALRSGGMTPKPKSAPKPANISPSPAGRSGTPKRKPAKPIIDPAKGFRVTKAVAEAAIAGGAADRRTPAAKAAQSKDDDTPQLTGPIDLTEGEATPDKSLQAKRPASHFAGPAKKRPRASRDAKDDNE